MTVALRFRNLTLGYDRHPAVHHLDGAVETGALLAVVGPNGAGKSTLFKGIVGVIKPLAGRIERGDPNPQNIAYLPDRRKGRRGKTVRGRIAGATCNLVALASPARPERVAGGIDAARAAAAAEKVDVLAA